MDEPTTTAPDELDAGAITAEPEEVVTEAAAESAEPQTTEATEPSEDDTSGWLQKKGIDPSDPAAIAKVAEMARNAERKMHESTNKASQLEKSLKTDIQTAVNNGDDDTVNRLAAEVQALKTKDAVTTFLSTGSPEEIAEKKELEPVMGQLIADDPQLGALVKSGYLSLDHLYALAKGSDASREAKLKQDGGREALEKVADRTSAKAVVGSATTSDLSGPQGEDPFDAGFNRNGS